MTQQPATPDLAPLDRFVGVWDTEGEVGAGDSAVRFEATDEYEWLAGGYFLLHKFRARMPEGEASGIEVISHDPASNTFELRSFDNTGSSSVMSARHEGDRWSFVGEQMRFSGAFSPDGREFSGIWESRPPGASTWQPWMTVRLSKRRGGRSNPSGSAMQAPSASAT